LVMASFKAFINFSWFRQIVVVRPFIISAKVADRLEARCAMVGDCSPFLAGR